MNKGLEVIEAARLFEQPGERVLVAIHPQSIAHAFVWFRDGSVKGQLCAPDMRLPIGYALSYPDRLPTFRQAQRDTRELCHPEPVEGSLDPLRILGAQPGAAELRYEFERPDLERFPCLGLAYEALARGGTAPAVLSAANEVAVRSFVEGKVRFGEIARIIERTLQRVAHRDATLTHIREADSDARLLAAEYVEDIKCT